MFVITIEEIKEHVKKEIEKDLFSDEAVKSKVLKAYLFDNSRDKKKFIIAKVSQYFLEDSKEKLLEEYKHGKTAFFEEHKYEKILNEYLRTKYDLEENDPNVFKNNKINTSNNQNTSKKLEISKKCKADKTMYLKQQKEHGFYANKAAKQYKIDKESVYLAISSIQKKCRHKDGEPCKCKRTNKKCSPYSIECLYYKDFMNKLVTVSKANNINSVVKKEIQKPVKVKKERPEKKKKVKPVIKETTEILKINAKDFVVRTHIFRCMHNNHKIENIDAIVAVTNEDGKQQECRISAGYCPRCKVYFMMESTYQNLKRKGIITCRITDEKTYMRACMNGVKLAQESILMQYGYNVSQTKGLSFVKRQKILAVIIDNKVLSKSEIISYLDFFIRQRSGMSNMELAISKWEADREFVENYKIGHYTQFGVNAIHRR